MMRDPRAIIDTTVAPAVFVLVAVVLSLELAAVVAGAIGVGLLLERVIRRADFTNALGGLLGTGVCVFVSLKTGSIEGYFVPKIIQNAVQAIALAGSVVVRRPLIGLLWQLLMQKPGEWFKDPRVRRVFSELSLAWAGLFALRATIYTALIIADKAEWIGGVILVVGWPAFALLVYFSLRYGPKRLEQLGAPDVENFTPPEPGEDEPEPSSSRPIGPPATSESGR